MGRLILKTHENYGRPDRISQPVRIYRFDTHVFDDRRTFVFGRIFPVNMVFY